MKVGGAVESTATARNARGLTSVHPLLPEDASAVAAMRAAMPPKGGRGEDLAERRRRFDAMMAATPLPDGVRTEEDAVGGVPGWWCRPATARPEAFLLYLHGGGYVQGRAVSFRGLAGHLARRAGENAFVPDYRLAPEHAFPAAFDDALAVYRTLARDRSRRIVVAGDSAGGGLTLALLSALADEPDSLQPCGAAALSPLTDLATTGESMETRAEADPLFDRSIIAGLASQYLQDEDPGEPRASPLYAELARLPPIRIDVGEDEVLLDDARRYAERARAAGTDVALAIWAGMSHVFQTNVGKLRAAEASLDAVGAFLKARLEH